MSCLSQLITKFFCAALKTTASCGWPPTAGGGYCTHFPNWDEKHLGVMIHFLAKNAGNGLWPDSTEVIRGVSGEHKQNNLHHSDKWVICICNIILTGVSAFVVWLLVCSVDIQVNIGLSQIPMSVSDIGDVLRYALMFCNNALWGNM